VGIRTRVHTMERATFLTAWREHKIRGVIMGLGAPAGNAATRIEVYVAKNGIYASGVVPEIEDLYQRQARELDRKKLGPRVEEAAVDHIKGFSYSAPYEDPEAQTRAVARQGRRSATGMELVGPARGVIVAGGRSVSTLR
jgi:hypothetical protein